MARDNILEVQKKSIAERLGTISDCYKNCICWVPEDQFKSEK